MNEVNTWTLVQVNPYQVRFPNKTNREQQLKCINTSYVTLWWCNWPVVKPPNHLLIKREEMNTSNPKEQSIHIKIPTELKNQLHEVASSYSTSPSQIARYLITTNINGIMKNRMYSWCLVWKPPPRPSNERYSYDE